ncbi:unnamed protein product, partial [Brassica oleracea var. botrytis]
VERWRIYDVVDILENIGILSLSSEKKSSLLERFCSDSSLFASTQGRRFEKGFWYLEYLQHIDGNHSSGDSNEAGTKLGVHNINANSGFPETVDLVFYMDKIEKACDLRDFVFVIRRTY